MRVLELIENPAQVWFGKREKDVAKLKEENEVLRALVKDSSQSLPVDRGVKGMVPKATLEVVEQEKAELQQTIRDKEKRLQRLKEVRSSQTVSIDFTDHLRCRYTPLKQRSSVGS